MTGADNLFARDGFFWWVGVVEDRMDPLKLGRCRVRIIGYHIDNQGQLPTEDLPWAMPMQGITSAAISGKGDTPLGPLEGTWVIGFFADGKECQQPIMMGTFGGMPTSSNACGAQSAQLNNVNNVQRDTAGNIIKDDTGNAIPIEPVSVDPANTASGAISSTLPPLSQSELQSLMNYIATQESSSIAGGAQNYTAVNSAGYVGKYQFGAAALQTLGYVRTPIPKRTLSNSELSDSTLWTGKDGVNSLNDFKANKNNSQENAMYSNLEFNYNQLINNGVIDAGTSTRAEVAGYLSTAHLLGAGGAKDLALGKNGADGNGTRASTYYNIGAQAVGGSTEIAAATNNRNSRSSALNPVMSALTNWAGALNNPKLGHPDPYSDPNSVYPRCPYTNRADTNKLATNNDDLETTPQPEKTKTRIEDIATANAASGTWAEPPSAYNARYPYNHVKETESGHIIELDDTPNAERIHIYHRAGTYVEIDKDGTVSYRVKGENYEIFNRNNRMLVQGNFDVTVDGANTLLVKNTLDVEVLGKTTINIKNSADINVSQDLRIKAQNIYMEAQQDFNIKSGLDTNIYSRVDMNVRVDGDYQNRVGSDYDLDASTVNINSGTANARAASGTDLDNGIVSGVSTAGGFEATGLTPLPTDVANPQTAVSKTLPSLLGSINSGAFNTALAAAGGTVSAQNLLGGGGLGGILKNFGVTGLNNLLSDAGLSSVNNILANAGIGNIGNLNTLYSGYGLEGIDALISSAGLGNLEKVLGNAGFDISSALGNVFDQTQALVLDNIVNAGLVPAQLLAQGMALIDNFKNNGVANISTALPKLVPSVAVNDTEFSSWTAFPDTAQLSKHFNLGDLSSRVSEVAFQTPLLSQAGLTKSEIMYNLKSLAVNTLDPITDKYPNIVISDAFRPTTENLIAQDNNNPVTDLISSIRESEGAAAAEQIERSLATPSPHNQGRAANLQFAGADASEYYNIALWIRDNVAYDQLRLEYTTLGAGTPWITVTQNAIKNRDPEAVDKIVTCMNGQVIANYLVDLTS